MSNLSQSVPPSAYPLLSQEGLVDHPTYIYARKTVASASFCLFLSGLCQFIATIVLLRASNNHYGSWWVGIISIIVGARGVSRVLTRLSIKITCLSGIAALVVTGAGSSIDGISYQYISSMQACSSIVPAGSVGDSSCLGVTNSYLFDCYGNSDYYAHAVNCEATAQTQNMIVDCACVDSTSSNYPCYTFNGYNSCDYVLDTLPVQIRVTYALSLLCALAAFFLVGKILYIIYTLHYMYIYMYIMHMNI